MTDLNSEPDYFSPDEEDLRQGAELLFHACRDLSRGADAILAKHGFGRAHHRVLYFVGRNPSLGVGAILEILKVTKQSLSRALGRLVRQGSITQSPGNRDRRHRLLNLTAEGEALKSLLFPVRRQRLARAYRDAGFESAAGFVAILRAIVDKSATPRTGHLRPSQRPAGSGAGYRP